jgi:autophagy-related protein 11
VGNAYKQTQYRLHRTFIRRVLLVCRADVTNRPDSLKAWIANQASIPVDHQILITGRGKNVRQQNLLTEVCMLEAGPIMLSCFTKYELAMPYILLFSGLDHFCIDLSSTNSS